MTAHLRPSTAGHFELKIDRQVTTAYLKAVDGGHIRSAVMDEPIGPENHRIKHSSVAEIEPISIELGLAGANDVLKWIQGSWRKEFARHSGQITHADFEMRATLEHEFFDALITETIFPTLDGASKDTGYIKIKLQPENVVTKRIEPGSQKISAVSGTKQKLWTNSAFRFTIDGIPEFEHVNKLDSFTIKQGVKKLYTGLDRFPQIEPTKIEFPHLTGTISSYYCKALNDWHEKSNKVGSADPSVQKHGSIEFLAPNLRDVLFRIELNEVGLFSLQTVASTANSNDIKRTKFELYVGRMDIDGKGTLGLD